jgi:hypothetical protein
MVFQMVIIFIYKLFIFFQENNNDTFSMAQVSKFTAL